MVAARACLLKSALTDGAQARGTDGQADGRAHGAEIEDGAEVRALTGDLFPVDPA